MAMYIVASEDFSDTGTVKRSDTSEMACLAEARDEVEALLNGCENELLPGERRVVWMAKVSLKCIANKPMPKVSVARMKE